MYVETPDILISGPDERLWRYMSLDKFTSLIRTGSLYFHRADKFEDPYEGTVPHGTTRSLGEAVAQEWLAEGTEKAIRRAKTAEIREAIRRDQIGGSPIDQSSSLIFVNCWHRSSHESEAMWQLYAGRGQGIAVTTTIDNLKKALICDEEVTIGDVKYHDYSRPVADFPRQLIDRHLAKRISFQHEWEVRAILPPQRSNDGPGFVVPSWWTPNLDGHTLEVDLPTLIDGVVIGPGACGSTVDDVKDVCNEVGLEVCVTRSLLSDPPERMPYIQEINSSAADYIRSWDGLDSFFRDLKGD